MRPDAALVSTSTDEGIVNLDTTNAAYSATLGGYVIPVNVSNVTVTVTALTGGSAANVVIGGISSLAQAIAGVDTVTNSAAFANGEDAETDNRTTRQ